MEDRSVSGPNAKVGLSLGEIGLEGSTLELDLKILERYQASGSELLRVASLAIAGLSAVWLKLYVTGPPPVHHTFSIKICMMACFLLLTLCCGAELLYMYLSADSMSFQLSALRRRRRNRTAGRGLADIELARVLERMRDRQFRWSSRLLYSAMSFLLCGVVCFGVALLLLMF